MRVKRENKYNYFGIEFYSSKPKNISLESFIKRDYKLRTYQFFETLVFDEFYKVLDINQMIEYFTAVKKENNEAKRLKKKRRIKFVSFWCDEILKYLENTNEEKRIEEQKKMYDKYNASAKMSYERYQIFLSGCFEWLKESYVFTDSLYYVTYSDKFFEKEEKELMLNYKINMDYFDSLSKDEFIEKVETFKVKYRKAIQITDLNDDRLDGMGYYVLILDNYKQVYVGATRNLKERILQHWQREKEYDRRIFGNAKESKISIDSFGPFDTTRIFIIPDFFYLDDTYPKEKQLIKFFGNKHVINRVDGNILDRQEAIHNPLKR